MHKPLEDAKSIADFRKVLDDLPAEDPVIHEGIHTISLLIESLGLPDDMELEDEVRQIIREHITNIGKPPTQGQKDAKRSLNEWLMSDPPLRPEGEEND